MGTFRPRPHVTGSHSLGGSPIREIRPAPAILLSLLVVLLPLLVLEFAWYQEVSYDTMTGPVHFFILWTVPSVAAASVFGALSPSSRKGPGVIMVVVVAVMATVLSLLLAGLIWSMNSGSGGPPIGASTLAAGGGSLGTGLLGLLLIPPSHRILVRLAPSLVIVCLTVVIPFLFPLLARL